eukprot:TRINITY_DN1120_c0_g1_i1.p1 TRINITY_DN1120_c0_g1~~TRINITY_DN1120_c0_g1_i1.p1  ORF type:complete len:903 (+),score=270.21 TRINITY_DN1120_c0_g1_i1:338-3046(+)
MQVSFNINYFAAFGQNVAIVADHPSFGSWNTAGARQLNFQGNGNWKLDFIFSKDLATFNYRYILKNGDWAMPDSGGIRTLNLKEIGGNTLYVEDSWRSGDSTETAPHVNSSLIAAVAYGRDQSKRTKAPSITSVPQKDGSVVVHFQVHAVQVPPESVVRIAGESNTFGHWDIRKAPALSDEDFPIWKTTILVPKSELPTKYKFVVTDPSFGKEMWEDNNDRFLPYVEQPTVAISTSFGHNFDVRGGGVSIPVFSIRTKNGLGVGEFLDLKLMADWASACGLKLIQILPINDTSVRGDWRDSYPYSSLSVNALHPLYLHLPAITKDAALLKDIDAQKQKLNALPQIDYEAVLAYKLKVADQVFQTAKKDFFGAEFNQWLKNNEWVPQYALFCTLRDKFKTPDYRKWGEYENITKEKIAELTAANSPFYDRVSFYYFLQYHLHLQLKEASEYAVTKHVGIKGDIAIGVNPQSVDTWVARRLFRMDKSTGAPPDFFSDEGQNWGFPTYNWDEMAKDDYGWWRSRLRHMAQYFHAFRIDHILGFFRIWEMPASSVTGLLGRFYPSIPIWKDELSGTNMWDLQRFTEPYIRRHLIEKFFGGHADEVQKTYFQEVGYGVYKFKDQYNTEKKIVEHLFLGKDLTGDEKDKAVYIKNGLFRLVQNVILLVDSEDPNKFYPRIEMFKTSSYAELPDWQRETLYKKYIDYFYNRQEGLWATTALQRLQVMINSTKMLCCGEDLGMVPKCVEPVMRQLHILGLRIQRMSDDPKKEFYHPDEYDYMTVCTPSVHDTSTLRAWWEEDKATAQRFFNNILGLQGVAPLHADEFISSRIITQHLYSRSMWVILPIQDLFGLNLKYFSGKDPKEERINVPAIAEHYWRYRMHVNVEDLLADTQFQGQISQLLRETRRA